MSYNYLPLDHTPTTFQQIKNLIAYKQLISITFAGYEAVGKCADYLDKKLLDYKAHHGIEINNESLQNKIIDETELEQLQYDSLQSSPHNLGDIVPDVIVKLMLALKVKSLSYGHTGVQNETIQRLMDMHNNNILPIVHTQGSLADVCQPIIGMGDTMKEGKKYKGRELEKMFGWKPLKLKPKESLALESGTGFVAAYGLFCLVKANQLLQMADLVSAISFIAFNCNPQAFDACFNVIRAHKGEADTAFILRSYLQGSDSLAQINEDSDPTFFRCILQVHGAAKDSFNHVLKVFIQEINSVTENPSIFPDQDLILESGHYNAQHLTLNLDFLAIAINQLGNISKNRTTQLLSGKRGLPLNLKKNKESETGFKILQNIAAEIVNENQELCMPTLNHLMQHKEENSTSLGAKTAIKCFKLIDNLEKVLAIEMLCAVQAFDFKQPATNSPVIEKCIATFKEKIAFNKNHISLHDNITKAVTFINEWKI